MVEICTFGVFMLANKRTNERTNGLNKAKKGF